MTGSINLFCSFLHTWQCVAKINLSLASCIVSWICVRTSDALDTCSHHSTVSECFKNLHKLEMVLLNVPELDNRIIWKFSSLSRKCKTVLFVCFQFLCRFPHPSFDADLYLEMQNALRIHASKKAAKIRFI